MYLQTNLFVESNDCKKADRQRVFDVSGKARISLRILFERNLDLFGRALYLFERNIGSICVWSLTVIGCELDILGQLTFHKAVNPDQDE